MISLALVAVVLGVCSAQIAPVVPPVAAPIGAASPYYRPGVAPGVAPTGPLPYARILNSVNDVSFDGAFNYAYETENGISARATGFLQNPGTEAESQVQSGSYSYPSPDGQILTVNWVADENGFRAEGDHIPKASEEIARSVAYNLAHAAPVAPGIPGIQGAPAPFRYPGAAPIVART